MITSRLKTWCICAFVASSLVCAAPSVSAWSSGSGSAGWGQDSGSSRSSARAVAAGDRIVARLTRTHRTCERLPERYRAACIYTEYSSLARDVSRDGNFPEVAEALRDVVRPVRSAVAAAQDRQAPVVRVVSPSGQGTTAPLRPVRAERVSAVNGLAAARVEALQSVLLRSVAQTDPRAQQFQRIAAAFEGSALLLRS